MSFLFFQAPTVFSRTGAIDNSALSLLRHLTVNYIKMSAMGEGEGPNAPGEGPPLFIPRLTTTFTPHASCLAPTFTLPPRGVDRVSSDEDLSLTMATRGLEADCYPPYFAPLSEASVSTSTNVSVTFYPAPYYSPGICPHAYTAVSQQVDSSGVATSTCCPE